MTAFARRAVVGHRHVARAGIELSLGIFVPLAGVPRLVAQTLADLDLGAVRRSQVDGIAPAGYGYLVAVGIDFIAARPVRSDIAVVVNPIYGSVRSGRNGLGRDRAKIAIRDRTAGIQEAKTDIGAVLGAGPLLLVIASQLLHAFVFDSGCFLGPQHGGHAGEEEDREE